MSSTGILFRYVYLKRWMEKKNLCLSSAIKDVRYTLHVFSMGFVCVFVVVVVIVIVIAKQELPDAAGQKR